MVSPRFFCLNLLSIVAFLWSSSIGVDASPDGCAAGILAAFGYEKFRCLSQARKPPPIPRDAIAIITHNGEDVPVRMADVVAEREMRLGPSAGGQGLLAQPSRAPQAPRQLVDIHLPSGYPLMPYTGRRYRMTSEAPVHVPGDKYDDVDAEAMKMRKTHHQIRENYMSRLGIVSPRSGVHSPLIHSPRPPPADIPEDKENGVGARDDGAEAN